MNPLTYAVTVNPLSADDAFRHASFGLEYVERKVCVPLTFDPCCSVSSYVWMLKGSYQVTEGMERRIGVVEDIQ